MTGNNDLNSQPQPKLESLKSANECNFPNPALNFPHFLQRSTLLHADRPGSCLHPIFAQDWRAAGSAGLAVLGGSGGPYCTQTVKGTHTNKLPRLPIKSRPVKLGPTPPA
eukprot:6337071-Amphidinium_carterae.2